MSWTDAGDGLPTSTGTAVAATSTSTVLASVGSGSVCLRMFGVLEGQLERPFGPGDWQTSAPTGSGVEPGTAGSFNVAWVDSSSASPASAGAADLVFLLDNSSPPLQSTAIPTQKEGKLLDEGTSSGSVVPSWVTYKDVHVLEVPELGGWLMLLARYHSSAGALGASGSNPDPMNSVAAIVAYWAPASDPTFVGPLVTGPFWLVSRLHDLGEPAETPLWLGVPAAIVLIEGGVQYLYVYYAVAETTFNTSGYSGVPSAFRPGTWLRRVALTEIAALLPTDTEPPEVPTVDVVVPDFSHAEYSIEASVVAASLSRALGGGAAGARAAARSIALAEMAWINAHPSDPSEEEALTSVGATVSTSTGGGASRASQEEDWCVATSSGLLPGETLGQVRVWIAIEGGTEFVEGDDPATSANGNIRIEEQYYSVQVVDPVPVWCAGQLTLYFCANTPGGTDTAKPSGWGIWRAVAVPPGCTSTYGLDFAAGEYVEGAQDGGMVMASPYEEGPALRQGLLDPDPCELPDGSWVLFAGWNPPTDGTPGEPLSRFEADAATAGAAYADAWA
jgi:hypothetical protein